MLILVGVELPLCIVVTIPECYNLFSGFKLSIESSENRGVFRKLRPKTQKTKGACNLQSMIRLS